MCYPWHINVLPMAQNVLPVTRMYLPYSAWFEDNNFFNVVKLKKKKNF